MFLQNPKTRYTIPYRTRTQALLILATKMTHKYILYILLYKLEYDLNPHE